MQARYDCLVVFNEYAFANNRFTKEFDRRKANMDYWMNMSVSSSSRYICFGQIRNDNLMITEWYLPDDKELYYKFISHKSEIENEINVKFDLGVLPTKKASRTVVEHSIDFDKKEPRFEIFDLMINIAIKMKKHL